MMGKEGAIKTRRWADTKAIWKRREKEGAIQAFPNMPHKTTLEFVLAEIQNKQNGPGCGLKERQLLGMVQLNFKALIHLFQI